MELKKVTCHPIPDLEEGPILFVGPPLDDEPLPAVFYFLTTAEESLTLDPFNQPVAFLADSPLRIFSLDVPGHGPGLDNAEAIGRWAEMVQSRQNFVHEFTERCRRVLDQLVTREIIDPMRVAAAGVSRGAFMATHFAAVEPRISSILGFAPLTKPAWSPFFEGLENNSLAESLALHHLCPQLTHRNIRFYMGNRDEKVGTANAFHFVERLAETAFQKKVRSPKVELFITPSIGHKGHGTSSQHFKEGAEWLAQTLTLLK